MPRRDPNNFAAGDQRKQHSEDGRSSSGPRDNFTQDEMDEMQLWGWQIGHAMKRGNLDAAMQLVRDGMEAMREQIEQPMLAMLLGDVGIEVRICNLLETRNVFNVKQFLDANPEDLMTIANFGYQSLISTLVLITKFAVDRVLKLESLVSELRAHGNKKLRTSAQSEECG